MLFDCFIGHARFSFILTSTKNALPWLSCRCWRRCPGWCAESRWVHSVFAAPPAEMCLKLTTAERSRQTTFNPHSLPTLAINVWNWRVITAKVSVMFSVSYLQQFRNISLQRLCSSTVQVWHHHLQKGNKSQLEIKAVLVILSTMIQWGIFFSLRYINVTWKMLYFTSFIAISFFGFPSGPKEASRDLNLKNPACVRCCEGFSA